MTDYSPALLTDLYELTMAQAYLEAGVTGTATFSLFIRGYPPNRGYFVTAGLADVLNYLETFRFSEEDLEYLRSQGQFSRSFVDYLRGMRFTGAVRAIPEGTVCFSEEPLMEITAPIVEAQLVETYLLNQVTLQTMLATKASRVVHAAAGRSVVDFAARRTQGTDAAIKAARAGYIAGYDGTSNVLAAAMYGIPAVGTMAHSFVMAFKHEIEAFRAYARSFPESSTLLVDTYDTLEGVRKAAVVGKEMAAAGHRLRAIRLDSGELAALARQSRQILDDAGLRDTRIVASGGLDEFEIDQLVRSGAPIDGFGVGTRPGVSADAPYLDSVYKMVEYEGRPVQKLSTSKRTLPGRKQVFRIQDDEGLFAGDVIALEDEAPPDGAAVAVLTPVMKDGRRVSPEPVLGDIRTRLQDQLRQFPDRHKSLKSPEPYCVQISPRLTAIAGHTAAPGL